MYLTDQANQAATKQMNSKGKNKETMNKHAYLVSSANDRSFSDPCSEPLLVCNCSAILFQLTMAAKAWRQMKNKFILYACRRGLIQG
ncbi:hypothetical protein T05_3508 [Trichinella murrelli]|uniref:Uncharacterized protein n=1 Tax=Trichinella murrelli TaxID=144512 RepID=A0A0V0TEG9_9BILA|nr:hypothetical protein T05_3508 [Trichinella murrelli]